MWNRRVKNVKIAKNLKGYHKNIVKIFKDSHEFPERFSTIFQELVSDFVKRLLKDQYNQSDTDRNRIKELVAEVSKGIILDGVQKKS